MLNYKCIFCFALHLYLYSVLVQVRRLVDNFVTVFELLLVTGRLINIPELLYMNLNNTDVQDLIAKMNLIEFLPFYKYFRKIPSKYYEIDRIFPSAKTTIL